MKTESASLRLVLAAWALVFALTAFGQNQRVPPHIGFVYPAGGRQGTSFTVSIGGQNLNGTSHVYVTGDGVAARIVGYDRPLTQKEFNDLRDKIQALQEKRAAARGLPLPERPNSEGKKRPEEKAADTAKPTPDAPKPVWTVEDEKALADLRAQVAKRPNRQANPVIAETVTLEVTVAPDAALGDREVRITTEFGLSNPMLFQIGQLPEHTKPVVTATENPLPRGKRDPMLRPTRPQPADTEITVPTIVNGQILPGEVDRYRFTATKGQRLTVAVSARTLIPYLADAVPGWFQATAALYEPQGREVAYGDSFRFSPDPVVSYEIPADGVYALELKDSIYRGREDFIYRVAIGELPFVTGLFPLGGRYAEAATFDLTGWNLPTHRVTMDTKDKAPGTFLLSLRERGQLSNAVRFVLDAEKAVRETDTHATAATAQPLTLPVVVDGRIDRPGDEDWYRFEGRKGDPIVAEVFARRLGSPLDSLLTLLDNSGHELACNDDFEDKGAGLMTHHADSRLSITLPADGAYLVRLVDTQHQGGRDYAYRLRVGAPQPDFELRVVPSSINARAGMHVPITVYALRRDGFAGDIVLGLGDAPLGFGLSGARIPAGQDKVQLTLSTPPYASDQPIALSMTGAAVIDGKPVAHAAVPAEDMMQAFAYHHLVPAKALLVDVVGRPGPVCRVLNRGTVRIPAGGTAKITIAAAAARGLQKVAIELSDPPAGIAVKSATVARDTVEIVLTADPAKIKPGTQGNLIFNAFGERQNPNAAKAAQKVVRLPLGSAPAVPFEIVAAAAPVAKS